MKAHSRNDVPFQPARARPAPGRWFLLLVVMLADVPIALDMTILHVAVPGLTLALGATGTQILWILDVYPLVMAGLLVPMGTLVDRFGVRRMLLTGLALFMAASALAACSFGVWMLVGARACLALGAAMIIPGVLAAIRLTFEDQRERAIALGMWATVSCAGMAVGPLAGGLLMEYFAWNAVFWVNVPLIAVILPFAWRALPPSRSRRAGAWPIGQALVLTTGLMLTVYALKSGLRPENPHGDVLLMFGGGLGLLVWFIRLQYRAPLPMLDPGLFALPALRVGLVIAFTVSGVLAGLELTLAQELQFVFGYSPLEAGTFMLPMMVAAALGGPVAGFLVARAGLRVMSTLSLAVAASGLAGIARADLHEPTLSTTLLLLALGFSLSIGLTASSIAIMNSAPRDKGGAAGSIESFGYDLGTGLGITAFGLVLSSCYKEAMHGASAALANAHGQAAHSIADTMVAAGRIGGREGAALAEAGRQAFTLAHDTVLLSAAGIMAGLAVLVCFLLRRRPAAARAGAAQ